MSTKRITLQDVVRQIRILELSGLSPKQKQKEERKILKDASRQKLSSLHSAGIGNSR